LRGVISSFFISLSSPFCFPSSPFFSVLFFLAMLPLTSLLLPSSSFLFVSFFTLLSPSPPFVLYASYLQASFSSAILRVDFLMSGTFQRLRSIDQHRWGLRPARPRGFEESCDREAPLPSSSAPRENLMVFCARESLIPSALWPDLTPRHDEFEEFVCKESSSFPSQRC
jgi:hypothetical protein